MKVPGNLIKLLAVILKIIRSHTLMILKIYFAFWAALLLLALALYLVGLWHPLVVAFLCFCGITLSFMGMISVVPTYLEHEDE